MSKQSTPPAPAPVVTAPDFMRWLTDLRVDLAETVGGTLLRGARVVQVGDTDGATARPAIGAGSLVGYSIAGGAAGATVYLRDGVDADGALVATFTLAADESTSAWFGPGGLNLSRGLFVDVAAGSIEGAVYLRGSE